MNHPIVPRGLRNLALSLLLWGCGAPAEPQQDGDAGGVDAARCPGAADCWTPRPDAGVADATVADDGGVPVPDAGAVDAGPPVDAGMPMCDPLDQSTCTVDEGCYLNEVLGMWAPECVSAGSMVEGESCASLNHCAPGLDCDYAGRFDLGLRCYRFCDTRTGMPCGAGQSCVGRGGVPQVPHLGYCMPARAP